MMGRWWRIPRGSIMHQHITNPWNNFTANGWCYVSDKLYRKYSVTRADSHHNTKNIFLRIWISIIKIRWSWDHLIFIMETPILVKRYVYWDGPWLDGLMITFHCIQQHIITYACPRWLLLAQTSWYYTGSWQKNSNQQWPSQWWMNMMQCFSTRIYHTIWNWLVKL